MQNEAKQPEVPQQLVAVQRSSSNSRRSQGFKAKSEWQEEEKVISQQAI